MDKQWYMDQLSDPDLRGWNGTSWMSLVAMAMGISGKGHGIDGEVMALARKRLKEAITYRVGLNHQHSAICRWLDLHAQLSNDILLAIENKNLKLEFTPDNALSNEKWFVAKKTELGLCNKKGDDYEGPSYVDPRWTDKFGVLKTSEEVGILPDEEMLKPSGWSPIQSEAEKVEEAAQLAEEEAQARASFAATRDLFKLDCPSIDHPGWPHIFNQIKLLQIIMEGENVGESLKGDEGKDHIKRLKAEINSFMKDGVYNNPSFQEIEVDFGEKPSDGGSARCAGRYGR